MDTHFIKMHLFCQNKDRRFQNPLSMWLQVSKDANPQEYLFYCVWGMGLTTVCFFKQYSLVPLDCNARIWKKKYFQLRQWLFALCLPWKEKHRVVHILFSWVLLQDNVQLVVDLDGEPIFVDDEEVWSSNHVCGIMAIYIYIYYIYILYI